MATAPGKIILFGEHAVVYGKPAIAAPIKSLQSTAVTTKNDSNTVTLNASDLSKQASSINECDEEIRPLYKTLLNAKNHFNLSQGFTTTISSNIPFGAGMGSSASTAVALIKSVAEEFNVNASVDDVNELAFQTEKLQHGTPSGVDNTVIAYNAPVYFKKSLDSNPNTLKVLKVSEPFNIVIANTGVKGNTKQLVGGVRERWQASPEQFNEYFQQVEQITVKARNVLESNLKPELLGLLMNENQDLLEKIGVSHPSLEKLCTTALENNALGAKLVGAGGGGNMIALTREGEEEKIQAVLQKAGAVSTTITRIE